MCAQASLSNATPNAGYCQVPKCSEGIITRPINHFSNGCFLLTAFQFGTGTPGNKKVGKYFTNTQHRATGENMVVNIRGERSIHRPFPQAVTFYPRNSYMYMILNEKPTFADSTSMCIKPSPARFSPPYTIARQ